MRKKPTDKVEAGRILHGEYGSRPGSLSGAFLAMGPTGSMLKIISAPGDDPVSEGWEHVSVSIAVDPKRAAFVRCPNWPEMCWVKDQFWEPEECVIQFHPPASVYVNHYPSCLHLWAHVSRGLRPPPSLLVGPSQEPK